MEKKSTMLLTVIAVATLLVAVVGATFAYFSVTGDNDEVKTTVNATAEDVGVVSLSNPTTEPLHLNLKASDMSKYGVGGNSEGFGIYRFYATTGDKNYATEDDEMAERVFDIAKISVVGGDPDTIYRCSFKINVNVSGTMSEVIKDDDAEICFWAKNNTTSRIVESGSSYNICGPLSEDQTFTADMQIQPSRSEFETIRTEVYMENQLAGKDYYEDPVQNYLAGKSLQIEISNSDFSCDVVEEFEYFEVGT